MRLERRRLHTNTKPDGESLLECKRATGFLHNIRNSNTLIAKPLIATEEAI